MHVVSDGQLQPKVIFGLTRATPTNKIDAHSQFDPDADADVGRNGMVRQAEFVLAFVYQVVVTLDSFELTPLKKYWDRNEKRSL
jgi:hypothetical protein